MSSATNNPQITAVNPEEDDNFLFAMQLASASVLPMVLRSAIELDLLELIKKAGAGAFVSAAELAAQLPATNAEAHVVLERILRFLSSYAVLECRLKTLPNGGVKRLYGLAPVCDFLTKNDDGVSVAPLLIMNQDKVLMESWYHLEGVVLDGGIPFNKAYGMSAFEYHGRDPRFNKMFNRAMSNTSTIILKKILETYKGFDGLKTVVDVGGGTGATLNMIVSKYPSINGFNFDLPHVVQDAPPYPGVEHVGGDMFESVPKGDAVLLKWICHDWSDEVCVRLLKKCHDAVGHNGKVIVAESLVPEAPDNVLASKLVANGDAIMMAHSPGGKERTEREFQALARAAGFTQFNKACCACNTWIMELLE